MLETFYITSAISRNICADLKVGNIVAEFLCMCLCLHAHLEKHCCGSRIFPSKFRNIFGCKKCFRISWHVSSQKNISNVQAIFQDSCNTFKIREKCFLQKCFLQKCFLVCPFWETWQNIDRKQCFLNSVSILVCPRLYMFNERNISLVWDGLGSPTKVHGFGETMSVITRLNALSQ